MKNILILLIFSFSIAFLGCESPSSTIGSSPAAKPNFLLITVEDISPLLGCYGDSVAITPHLDKLADESIRFTNVYATAGVCAPARCGLITGMYPSAIGGNYMRVRNFLPEGVPAYEATPPAGVKCYSELMRQSGYYCVNNQKEDYQFNAPVTAWDESSRLADWRNRPGGMPFLSIWNIMTSHESQVWDRANDPVVVKKEQVTVPPYYPDAAEVRKDIARVYSNITVMDKEVGEILDRLKADGLLDSTIVIFYSDHGGPLPRQKREIYDSGLKVPMLIRLPGAQSGGTVNDELVSFIDIPATILSLAGISPPEWMHGQAFMGDYEAAERKYIFAARDRMDAAFDVRRAVKDKRYKYIKNFIPGKSRYLDIDFRKNLGSMQKILAMKAAGQLSGSANFWFQNKPEEELYDTWEDPHEVHNLASDPKYSDKLKELRAAREEWSTEFGDMIYMEEEELVRELWPGLVQPETAQPDIQKDEGRVKITCTTEGASIGYRIYRDEKPGKRVPWQVYTKPVELKDGESLEVVAHRIGYKSSKILTI